MCCKAMLNFFVYKHDSRTSLYFEIWWGGNKKIIGALRSKNILYIKLMHLYFSRSSLFADTLFYRSPSHQNNYLDI